MPPIDEEDEMGSLGGALGTGSQQVFESIVESMGVIGIDEAQRLDCFKLLAGEKTREPIGRVFFFSSK